MKPANTIAFLTGQSDPGRCALSAEQENFLAQLAGPRRKLVPLNFPYRPSAPFRRVPLAFACWHNLCGYFVSRPSRFAVAYRDDVTALIRQTERMIFLAGSSGLELFNNLRLPPDEEKCCTLICYGPVARRLPRYAANTVVQSSRDYLSRAFFRGGQPSLHCDHMGYLREEKFLQLCQAELSLCASPPCTSIFV